MAKYLEFEVSLAGVRPKLWRRFLLASSLSFADLHQAIQRACGWENSHLYEFLAKRRDLIAGPKLEDMGFGDEAPWDKKVPLESYFQEVGTKCRYVYDLGDGWEHTVTLKKVVELPETFKRRLLGGARAFPLEDCGGIPGYYECVELATMTPEMLAELDEEEKSNVQERREWMGEWDPEQFDLKQTKKRFDQ